MPEVESPRRCPLCDESRVSLKFEGDAVDDFTVGSSRTHIARPRVYGCGSCGSWFQYPALSSSAVQELYRETDDPDYVGEEDERRRNARKQAELVADKAETGGRLLDIGASAGFFVQAAEEKGFRSEGLEISEPLAKRAQERGANVRCLAVEEARFEDACFDVITLWDVLEHVHHPRQTIASCARWLKPGGHLFVNVPASDSFITRVFGKRWPLLLPEHLHYFTKKSLSKIYSESGLELRSTHLHPVRFSGKYIAARLAQHSVPGVAPLAAFLAKSRLGALSIPILMGELTAVGRKL